jgi:muconate cycloisomerase
MKINDLELFLVAVGHNDLQTPFHAVLVRVSTAGGWEGWGESGLNWRIGELSARREAILAVLAGRSAYDIEEIHTLEALDSAPLRSAVEMALWDLVARRLRQPLCNLFGGYFRRRVPISVTIPLEAHRASQAAHMARDRVDQGYRTLMLTTSGQPEEDLAALAAVRERVGDRVELRFDGLSRYEMDVARDLCASPEFEGLQFWLDPLNTPDLYRLASLGRQTSVPLAARRTIHGPADVFSAVRGGALSHIMVDLEQVGGMIPARACAAVAMAAGVNSLLAGRPSVGIATAAMLHLAAAVPAFSGSNEIASRQLHDTVIANRFETIDGMITTPQGPGLGIEVDRAKVEKYQIA